LSKITTGKSAGSTMNLEAFDAGAPVVPVDPTPAPSASPKPSASSSPSPSASPKVSASPKASPTPTPTASALKPKTYTVVSGDYWNKIVAKLSVWGVTDAKLSAANPKITNKNNLQLGAILIVP
jgi:nucleoid-associated protein YgaU